MDQEWLQKLGLGLGAAGGIAGGVGGLANAWNTGVTSLSDAARLAGNAGRVVGGVGQVADNDALKQAGGYLSAAGQGGAGIETLMNVLSGGVGNVTDVTRLAGGVGNVAGAAGKATGNRRLQQVAGLLGLPGRVGGGGPRQPRELTDDDWLRRDWRRVDTPSPVLANL
jgi:hypothetical protein